MVSCGPGQAHAFTSEDKYSADILLRKNSEEGEATWEILSQETEKRRLIATVNCLEKFG